MEEAFVASGDVVVYLDPEHIAFPGAANNLVWVVSPQTVRADAHVVGPVLARNRSLRKHAQDACSETAAATNVSRACIPWNMQGPESCRPSVSKLKTRSELHLAEVTGRGKYSAETAIARAGVRKSEALKIGNIKHFSTNLD